MMPIRTITMTLRLPRDVYLRWQEQGGAQAALEAQGLWPEQLVRAPRWWVDPVGPFYVCELEVIIEPCAKPRR